MSHILLIFLFLLSLRLQGKGSGLAFVLRTHREAFQLFMPGLQRGILVSSLDRKA